MFARLGKGLATRKDETDSGRKWARPLRASSLPASGLRKNRSSRRCPKASRIAPRRRSPSMSRVCAPESAMVMARLDGDGRFAFVRHSAGNEERLRTRPFIGHEENRGTDVAIRFGEDVARIVRLQKRDLALRFFLRNLAKHVFGELMLKFAEGSHAIVDPIEQNRRMAMPASAPRQAR